MAAELIAMVPMSQAEPAVTTPAGERVAPEYGEYTSSEPFTKVRRCRVHIAESLPSRYVMLIRCGRLPPSVIVM
jgi:hypothetical protein